MFFSRYFYSFSLFVLLGFLFSIILFLPEKSRAQIFINEIQSSNTTTIADEDGDFEDWIELYNSGETAIDLGFYGLSDNYDRPFKWVFPAGTIIESGDFLMIWASGKNRNDPNASLHTNFQIAQAGEEVLLTHYQTGERVDEIAPIEILSNHSYGRYPDGKDNFVFFSTPTPGASNSDESAVIAPGPVSFSVEGGFHYEPVTLELSAKNATEIRYTLDGTEPDANSFLYTEPLLIEDRSGEPNDLSTITDISHNYANAVPPADNVMKGTVVRAKAFGRGSREGTSVSRTYFIDPAGANRYTLPVICLSTQRDSLFGYDRGIYTLGRRWVEGGSRHNLGAPANYFGRGEEWERPMHMEMYETDGSLVVSQNIGVRIHGGASRAFPQKSFRLYSRSAYGISRFRYPFFPKRDLDNFNRLILRNSGQDVAMTMFRDAYIQETVRHLNFPTMATRAIILFINGEYWGIYNIRERYDKHYLESHYGVDPESIDLMTSNSIVKEGSRDHYLNLLSFIENNDPRINSHFEQIQTMMDTDNFMDYYIAQIYARNTDWPHNNVDYWRYQSDYNPNASVPEQDGRWRWMMFDMDFGFGWQPFSWPDYRPNDWNLPRYLDRESYKQNMMTWVSSSSRPEWSNFLYRRIMRNENYRIDFLNRFADLLNTTFLPERMTAILDSMKVIYAPEIEEHIIRWNKNEPEEWDFFWRPVITYDEWVDEVNVLRRFAEQRRKYQWEHLMDFTARDTAQVTLDVSEPAHGHIKINTIYLHPNTEGVDKNPWPWTGTYFRFRHCNLTAIPEPGYRFDHWLEVADGDTLFYSEDIDIRPGLRNDMHLIAVFKKKGTSSTLPEEIPKSFKVYPNYPNPFNAKTTLSYQLPSESIVTIDVFSSDGRKVSQINEGWQSSGTHFVRLDASSWASGLYVARVRGKDESGKSLSHQPIKMMLIR